MPNDIPNSNHITHNTSSQIVKIKVNLKTKKKAYQYDRLFSK